MNIYLDIDGVLITNHGEPSLHVYERLEHLTSSYTCYWLTTHCKYNNPEPAIRYLEDIIPESVEFLKKIKPTDWDILKTEAIDFSEKFVWLDDYLMQSEEKVLTEKDSRDGMIKINLKSNPHQLQEVLEAIRNGNI